MLKKLSVMAVDELRFPLAAQLPFLVLPRQYQDCRPVSQVQPDLQLSTVQALPRTVQCCTNQFCICSAAPSCGLNRLYPSRNIQELTANSLIKVPRVKELSLKIPRIHSQWQIQLFQLKLQYWQSQNTLYTSLCSKDEWLRGRGWKSCGCKAEGQALQ